MSQKRSKEDEEDYSDYDNDGEGEGKRGTSDLWDRFEELRELCAERGREIKKLKVELLLAKSNGRTTKKKMRSDYQWNGEDAILADKVSEWVKNYLFPRYKFLKKGWMEFSRKSDSLSEFAVRKMESSISSSSEYRDLWDRVIFPTIRNKYVTIRCNLTNEIRATYKGK